MIMWRLQMSMRRSITVAICIIICFITWNVGLLTNHNVKQFTMTCNYSHKFHEKLHNFAERVNDVLHQWSITHFLCYGSLWGQIRLSRSLPWEDKIVFCILNKDLTDKDEVFLRRAFSKEGMILNYESTHGQYKITAKDEENMVVPTRSEIHPEQLDDPPMTVLLVVFELDKLVGMYRRIGWRRRLLPPDCEGTWTASLDCFPPRLVKRPLAFKAFSKSLLAVPREGIEMQKYHYKDNWWKEPLVKNC